MTATVTEAGSDLPKDAGSEVYVHGRVDQTGDMIPLRPTDARDCAEPVWVSDTLAPRGQAGHTQTGF